MYFINRQVWELTERPRKNHCAQTFADVYKKKLYVCKKGEVLYTTFSVARRTRHTHARGHGQRPTLTFLFFLTSFLLPDPNTPAYTASQAAYCHNPRPAVQALPRRHALLGPPPPLVHQCPRPPSKTSPLPPSPPTHTHTHTPLRL
jgi:hypothetical protein